MTPVFPVTEYPMVVYPDVLTDGRACWVAEHPDLPGCVAYDADAEIAVAKLRSVREAYLDALDASGETAPAPSKSPKLIAFSGFQRPLAESPVVDSVRQELATVSAA